MPHRKLLIALALFHSIVNTLYLIRFFGIMPPEPVVYGYVPWFMSFALPNAAFTALSWLLVYALLKKRDRLAAVAGLLKVGGLAFHALNGFMFVFYTGSLAALTPLNAVFEIVVYAYGLAVAAVYVVVFSKRLNHNQNK